MDSDKGSTAVYEVSYLLLPTLSQEQVPGKVAGIKEALTSFGATLISDEDPVLIDLAYQMVKVVQTTRHKADEGYFGWVKFEIDPSHAEAIEAIFRLDEKIVRYIVIKTVRENTMSTKRPARMDARKKVEDDKNVGTASDIFSTKTESAPLKAKEEVKPMDAEEVDREIEAMVLPE